MILAVRHPRPAIAEDTCYGQLDVGLAEPVLPSAHLIARRLGKRHIDRIVTSPLRRAHDLALALAHVTGRPLVVDSRLMEIDFGLWEGLTWRQIARAEIDAWAADPLGYRPGGGEAALTLYERVAEVWRAAQDERILAQLWVTHAGPMRCLMSLSSGRKLSECLTATFAYCELCEFPTELQ